MDALIDRYAVHLLDGAQEIAEEKSIPVVERIIRVVMALNLSGGSGKLWSIFTNRRMRSCIKNTKGHHQRPSADPDGNHPRRH